MKTWKMWPSRFSREILLSFFHFIMYIKSIEICVLVLNPCLNSVDVFVRTIICLSGPHIVNCVNHLSFKVMIRSYLLHNNDPISIFHFYQVNLSLEQFVWDWWTSGEPLSPWLRVCVLWTQAFFVTNLFFSSCWFPLSLSRNYTSLTFRTLRKNFHSLFIVHPYHHSPVRIGWTTFICP